ncbi:hypothetical protein EJB05_45016 [Eragrostis curvula]|uniref:Uncharacterized protein n=1 Tax=Eragrostis curvula TaxID=38414 RepID=A0A5J9TJ87_9POAL|nr:hypothetical protein EJB05_45016 [Eragrostis curvula]
MGEKVMMQVPSPLPVTSMGIKKNKFQLPSLSIQVVLVWALMTASSVAAAAVVAFAINVANIPCSPNSWILSCDDHLTAAQEAELGFFENGFAWLAVPQAAAATAGLLLPRRRARSRWSLAFLALVAASVAHYMYARFLLVYLDAKPGPGGDFFFISDVVCSVIFIVGDLLSFVSLFTGGVE